MNVPCMTSYIQYDLFWDSLMKGRLTADSVMNIPRGAETGVEVILKWV